ncbi:MAG: glycosyltransferase family 4 protein [Candidatus Coatesbacteria bacterium]|nr:glycosyltransferase family 4 protein [Candidatus Coatesbacteria bacterium]
MPLIAINALQVLNQSGTGYYGRRVIELVPAVDPGLDYFVVLPSSFRANPLCDELAKMPNVRLEFVSLRTQSERILFEQLVLARLLSKAKADLLHSPAFVAPARLRQKSVLTVHDVAFKLFPDTLTAPRRLYLAEATERSVRKADRIIAVSHAAMKDIVRHLRCPPEKVAVIHEGGFEAAGLAPRLKRDYLAHLLAWDGDYILFIGTMEPRKNLERLLAAFSMLRRTHERPCKLVIVGRKGWLTKGIRRELAEKRIERDVILTGFLPDNVVLSLLQEARVFAMPSLYEGFGLPLVTAMACGTPIAASNAGAIPEVVGDAGLLVDPYDVEAMAEALRNILTSSSLAGQLAEAGKSRHEQFSWVKCAEETVKVYKHVLSA